MVSLRKHVEDHGKATGLNRRSFVQGALATIAATGVSSLFTGCSLEPDDGDAQALSEQVFQGVCPGDCGGACSMNVHVRDGKIVKTSKIDMPDPLMTRICQRGLTHAQRVYAPERIKQPIRRIGTRGEDKWEQITWDEAIAEICSKWKELQEKYGKNSIAFFCGTGNQGPDQYYYTRLAMALSASTISGSSDMNGLYMAALLVTRGAYLHGGSLNQILQSKKIFFWSSNATTSNHAKWSYVVAAKDNGAKLICIDPNFTLVAAKSDIWVPLRPGTDAALAMAMTNVVIDEGLADIDYLTKGTVAPFLVKEDGRYLRFSDIGLAEATEDGAGLSLDGAASAQAAQDDGSNPIVVMGHDGQYGDRTKVEDPFIEGSFTVEGVSCKTAYTLLRERIAEWTPDAAAAVCEVDADTIRLLAREYADGPTMNYFGFGMDHWVEGPWPYHAVMTLSFVAGQFGKPGASIDGSMQANMGITGVNVGNGIRFEGMAPGPSIQAAMLPEIAASGQLKDMPLVIKSIFCYMGNPCAGLPDRNAFLAFLETVEFFLVADSVMNDTVRQADMVLPTPHWFEVETFFPAVLPFVRVSEQAIQPLYESKSDIDIANLLGEGMGLSDIMNMTASDFHSACLSGPAADELGLSWESVKAQKMIRVLPDDYVFGDNYTLPTPTGKAEFYQENIPPRADYGQSLDKKLWALPHWEPPREAWPDNPLFEQYPLTITSHRDKSRVNSMFCYAPWLEEIFPEPTIDISPADAETRGITTGDTVKAYNDRGFVVMRARVNPAIRTGFVDTPRASNKDRYIDGHYSGLSSFKHNDLVISNACNDTLIQVEKA
jgi:molybdopterin-containing oxidoreductase family molybdopterin binding subunit